MKFPTYQRWIVLLPLMLVSFCLAQKPLQIGPGDVVNVHVYDTPELEQSARVTDTGDIQLSLIGSVHVGSMTPEQAAREIERVLISKDVMKYPSVTVNVLNYETETVSVVGQVNRPGAVQITASRSVIDMISLSGGFTDFADRHILIRRKGPPAEVVPFYFSNDPREAVRNDVQVEPGDTVIVPKVGIVYVLGDVGRPGGYPINSPSSRITVLEAISLAGATNHTATPSNARLVRRAGDGYEDIHLQISKIQKGKAPDVEMMPDDVIYVPFSYVKNALSLGSSSIVSAATSAAIYTR